MKSHGSILIVAMFAMAVLSLIAVSFAYRAGLYCREERGLQIMTKLQTHASSAIAIALGRLLENENEFDHRAESWCTHNPLSAEGWLSEWEVPVDASAAYDTNYYVIDEESKLNLSFASSEAFQKLGLSDAQIACLIDWTDSDSIAQADGAETAFYQNRAIPYLCKNAPIEVLSELLLIKNFAAKDYFGEDINHNVILDPSEDDGPVSFPIDNSDGQLDSGLVDVLTSYGSGKININTAHPEVLKTLPITEESVDQILAFRAFDQDTNGNLEDHVFKSATDIEQLQGVSEIDKATLVAIAIFRSSYFRIFAVANHLPTQMQYRLEVVVCQKEGKIEILEWRTW